jgi:H2-forming N5,N10-methylenetetrahydromethanopterin dehydrogenase-like enzyme
MTRERINSLATERVLRQINNVDSQPLIEAFIAQADVGGPVKNVCAKLAKTLVDGMEDRCNLLQINKRQFIEAAIIDAIARVDAVVEQEGLHDVLAERAEALESVA